MCKFYVHTELNLSGFSFTYVNKTRDDVFTSCISVLKKLKSAELFTCTQAVESYIDFTE